MADANTSGLDALTQRMARARRSVPPPRRPAADIAQPAETAGESVPAAGRPAPAPAGQRPEPARDPRPNPDRPVSTSQTATSAPAAPLGDEPQANLMVRVRRSLDLRLDHVIYELRRQANIRTNKTELVEMLLWELPDEPDAELVERLGRYRQAAPRR